MNNIETMRLALKALTKLNASPHLEDCEGAFDDEIAALRQAIEQAQEQKPVGQLCEETYGRGQVMWFNKPVDGSYVYTSPPPRQPLTWERVLEIGLKCANDHSRLPYEVKVARAIEAAHGITGEK